MQEFTVDRDYVRVGIISDSQLPNTREENEYQNSLIRALSAFKARGVDMVLFGGDITDLSKSKAYDLYNAAYIRYSATTDPSCRPLWAITTIGDTASRAVAAVYSRRR